MVTNSNSAETRATMKVVREIGLYNEEKMIKYRILS